MGNDLQINGRLPNTSLHLLPKNFKTASEKTAKEESISILKNHNHNIFNRKTPTNLSILDQIKQQQIAEEYREIPSADDIAEAFQGIKNKK